MIEMVAIRSQAYLFALAKPFRHHDLVHGLAKLGHPLPINGEQGFIDSNEGFVSRDRAAEIAVVEGQVRELRAPPDLFSEDLW